jgi:UDP-2,3-diacylglucosamine pyrophosphatase LpxH
MVILVLILANVFAIFWGKYYTLTPILFYAGLAAICAISAWVSIEWQTKNLVVIAVSATLLSFIDEYAHTSVGTLAYFDGYVPSLLTVFGWSIFMIFLVGATKFISNIRWLQVEDHNKLRTLPVVISLGLIITSIIVQGYLDIFNWVIILVYLLLFAASFYYTSVHQLKLNLLMMAISLAFGLSMEYVGGMEGLWTFRFQDPVSLLILFSWPLRLYAVNALCAVAGVDFFSYPEQPVLEPMAEADKNQSLIVVADTHFGLRKENERSDPKAFSDFLNWIKSLETEGSEKLKAGIWSSNESETITIKQPEKLIFLGDILELWDASGKAIDACTRSIVQSLSELKAEKIYIFGNHDTELSEILDEYPLGASNLYFKEGEYVTTKGDKKLIFLHGHQFDKLFTLPSWRIMPYINNAATVFGAYTWIFVAFFIVDISLLFSIGFSGIADWLMLLVLGAVSIPFLIIKFARNIWNSLKSTKYKPEGAEKQLAKWWSGFSRKTDSGDWNIVYGHTHVVGFWSQKLGNDSLTLFNLPSWVKDVSQKNGVLFEMVFRHGFLYIDDQSTEFFGWDTDKKRPFLVPKDVIQTRLQNGDANRVGYDVENELQAIGWPQKLIEKWLGYSFENRALT